MLFGRAFERALGPLFRREDPGAVLFAEWSACQNEGLHLPQRRILEGSDVQHDDEPGSASQGISQSCK